MSVEALVGLVVATGRARTPAGLALALADGLALHHAIHAVELRTASGSTWRARPGATAATASRRAATSIPPRPDQLEKAGRIVATLPLQEGAWCCVVIAGTWLRDLPALCRVIEVALEHVETLGRVAEVSRHAHADGARLRQEVRRVTLPDEVVAESPAMRRLLRDIVPAVARRETPVLVRGETGCGKEVVARRVHALSARAHRPLLAVNCGALPVSLIESTLFGHEQGAFTGADRSHAGIFEQADGATLFLDEVAELPLAVQVKLLRVVQDGEVTRVGSTDARRADVRIIAATHRPLESMVERGTFRADLYYRLNVFPIEVPALRERRQDIEPLVGAALRRLAARQQRKVPRVAKSALARLRAHHWPGNVRELQNVLERAMLLSDDELMLPPGFEREAVAARTPRRTETWRESGRRCIEAALAASEGQLYGPRGAAALLGLKPTTLQSKMIKLGVSIRSRSRATR